MGLEDFPPTPNHLVLIPIIFVSVSVCETVNHALECGGGTGIFLAVNSSTIVVIRGKRACIWGSIYLDKFGEEDKELK
jgi:E3 ubiquitin-protein ligase UBR3